MIDIKINGTTYGYPERWQDMTLETAMRISEIDLPDVEDMFAWHEHMDKVIAITAIATNISMDDLRQVKPEAIVWLFVDKLLVMVSDIKGDKPQTYTPMLITTFKHNGKTYHLPTSLQIGDNVVLQHGQNAKRFVEASNLLSQYSKMRTAGITVMPMFISSVVKESENEVWDEAVVANRAKEFLTLPMNIFWEVFFCILALTYKQMKDTLQSTHAKKEKEKQSVLASRLGLLALRRQELREVWNRLMR